MKMPISQNELRNRIADRMWWLIPLAVAVGVIAHEFDEKQDEHEEISRADCHEIVESTDERRISRNLRKKLVVSFYGPPSAGKSTLVQQLFGVPRPSSPIPGTTRRTKRIEGCFPNTVIVDTPGVGGVDDEVAQRAVRFVDDTDIFVFLVNANGGVNIRVLEHIATLHDTGRPVLAVVNKIETIAPAELKRFITHQRKLLKDYCDQVVCIAADPLPAISAEPINLDAVTCWIEATVRRHGRWLLDEKSLAREREA